MGIPAPQLWAFGETRHKSSAGPGIQWALNTQKLYDVYAPSCSPPPRDPPAPALPGGPLSRAAPSGPGTPARAASASLRVSLRAGRRRHSAPSLPALLQTLPPQPGDFPAFTKTILLNISKKYSLTPSLFIYKNQLNTLLLCSIWKLEQPGLYLAEILLLSPQIPADPSSAHCARGAKEHRGRGGLGDRGVVKVPPRGPGPS